MCHSVLGSEERATVDKRQFLPLRKLMSRPKETNSKQVIS